MIVQGVWNLNWEKVLIWMYLFLENRGKRSFSYFWRRQSLSLSYDLHHRVSKQDMLSSKEHIGDNRLNYMHLYLIFSIMFNICDIKYLKENVLGHWCGCLSEFKTLGKVGIRNLHSICNCREQWRERQNLGNEETTEGIQIYLCNFPKEQPLIRLILFILYAIFHFRCFKPQLRYTVFYVVLPTALSIFI